jgi:hypothetical protein
MLWKYEDNNQLSFRIEPTRMNISKPGDSAGSEHLYPDFRLPVDMFKFADNNGMILVYSITSRTSFTAVESFVDARQREKRSGEVEPKVLCLVGNKLDASRQSRKVLCIEGEELAEKLGCAFIECSAKDQKGVDKVKSATLKAMDNQRIDMAKAAARKRVSMQQQERGTLVRSQSQAEVIKRLSEAGMMKPEPRRVASAEAASTRHTSGLSSPLSPQPQPEWIQSTSNQQIPSQHVPGQHFPNYHLPTQTLLSQQPQNQLNSNQPSTVWKNAVATGPPIQMTNMGKLSHYRQRGAINRSNRSEDPIEEEDEEEEQSTESTLESRSSSQQSSEPSVATTSVAPTSPPPDSSNAPSSSSIGSFFQHRPSLLRSSSRSSGTFVAEKRKVLTKEPPRSASAPVQYQFYPKKPSGLTRINPAAVAAMNRSLASPDPELPTHRIAIEVTPATPLTPLIVDIPKPMLELKPLPQESLPQESLPQEPLPQEPLRQISREPSLQMSQVPLSQIAQKPLPQIAHESLPEISQEPLFYIPQEPSPQIAQEPSSQMPPTSPTDSVVDISLHEKIDLDKERARLEAEKQRLEEQMKALEEQQKRLDEKRRLGEEMKLQQEKARKRKERKMLLERQEAEKKTLEARQQKEKEEMEARQRHEAMLYHDEDDDKDLAVQEVETPKAVEESKPPLDEKSVLEKPVSEKSHRREPFISENISRQAAAKLLQQKEIESLWDDQRPPPPPPRHALHQKKEEPKPPPPPPARHELHRKRDSVKSPPPQRGTSDKERVEREEIRSPSPRSPFHRSSFEREEALRSPQLRPFLKGDDAVKSPEPSPSTITPNGQSGSVTPQEPTQSISIPGDAATTPTPSAIRPSLSKQNSTSSRDSFRANLRQTKHKESGSSDVATSPPTGVVASLGTYFANKSLRTEKENVKESKWVDGKGVYGKGENPIWTDSKPRLPFPGKYV